MGPEITDRQPSCNSNGFDEIYQKFFNHLKKKSEYFIYIIERRKGCENWLQIEFLYILYQMRKENTISEFFSEKPHPKTNPIYGDPRCDLWFMIQDTEIWLQFQTIVTNYGLPGKPITNQVDHVLEDSKLFKELHDGGIRHLMFFVYPLATDGSNDAKWEKHLKKLTEHIEILMDPVKIPITAHDSLRIYLSQPK